MEENIRSVKSVITSVVYDYLGTTGTRVLDFIGNIVIGLLILLIGFKLIKHIIKIFDHIFEKSKIDSTLRTFLISFLKITLKILVIFFAITKIGVGTSSIIALIGSAGVAVGLSLQGSLANIAGGVILLLMKPFEVGDYILEEGSSKEGTVQSIGIMYTKLLSPETKTIFVPNGSLSGSSITNYTSQGKRRVKIQIGIEYDQDIRKVRQVIAGVLIEEKAKLAEPEPQIFVDEFQDSCICMGIHYWTTPQDYWASKWRVQEQIKEAFDKNGINIPFNRMDITILSKE